MEEVPGGIDLKLLDIKDMPGFNPSGPMNNTDSVSRRLVYFGRTENDLAYESRNAIPTVNCINHGAMNCVAHTKEGKLWRCLTCNVGAFAWRT